MSAIAPKGTSYNGLNAEGAILVLRPPQISEDKKSCYFQFDLYADAENRAKKVKVCDSYLNLRVHVEEPEGGIREEDPRMQRPLGMARELHKVCAEVSRAWGGRAPMGQEIVAPNGEEWADNLYGLGYQFFHLLPEYPGWVRA